VGVLRCNALLRLSIIVLACNGGPRWPGHAHATSADPATSSAAGGRASSPDPREPLLAQATLELLEREHLARKRIDDGVSRLSFATYLDRLDNGKIFLLKADRDALGKYADRIDDQLRAGALDLGHEGQRILIKRVSIVQAWVAELLASPLDLSNQEDLELDPEKTAVAATEAELKDRWRRRLEFEVLERVAQMEARLESAKRPTSKSATKSATRSATTSADPPKAPGRPRAAGRDDDDERGATPLAQIPKTRDARQAKARADLAKTYGARFTRLSHPGSIAAASDLINAITASIDPHTNYLPPADKANFDILMRGSLEGIGAVLREKDDYIEVVEIVPGGAAWRQGELDPGDLILSVTGDGKEPVDLMNMRIEEAVKMIRGPKGTVVTLRVRKPTGLEETVAITRDIVVVEETYARAAVISKQGLPAYAYLHLPGFYGGPGSARTSASDVRRLLGELREKRVAGIVVDVRSNGGGLLGEAIEMTGAFIDKGPVVQVQDSKGNRRVLTDDRTGVDFDGPVIVLVDRFSASASEILAGALQDYRRAIVVGGPTFGKGTVQTVIDLDQATGGKLDLGVFKLTIQQFFRVDGASTQREGVTPDIVLPDPAGFGDVGERELEHALPSSKTTPAKHDDWPATWKVKTLRDRSAARVAKDPAFAGINRLTQLMKARKTDTRVSLAETVFIKKRERDRAEIEAATPDLEKAPARFTVLPLDAREPAIASPSGRKDSRLTRWRDTVARDPWIDECLNIFDDLKK
jgi:carboxyl-terminal processing protease